MGQGGNQRMNEFLAMGGYAKFVWPAYALTFVAVFVNIAIARRAHRGALEEARRRLAVQGEE
jgi:heme exporter protein D